ncbi:fibronectin type III domain-containing protein [Streptomyces sp. NBC_01465]|uniref:fibronectin type III domain-containing protein n=1 Tax=Streptomyces sp. NBC_01465 TaxID=2903878 RepID=UPI002E3116D9|nr:fibronectin type III domain-containing protein [Streptomyces sp. NBC_01465]
MRRIPTLAAAALGLLLLAACSGQQPDTQRPPAPGGVSVQASSATSAHVMWGQAAKQDGVTRYEVFRAGVRVKTVGAGTTMVDIGGLSASSTYTFTVRALDAAGNASPAGKEVAVTLPAEVPDDHKAPSAPGSLRAVADGARAATLQWGVARDNVRVTSYDIYQGQSKIHTVGGNATAAHLTGLRPATVYTFTVRARDGADNASPPSPSADLTTASAPGQGPSTEPTAFTATARTAKGERAVELAWTVPRTGGEVKEYQMYLDGRLTTTIAYGAAAPRDRATYRFVVTEKAGTSYAVKIRARLPDGDWGTFSAERTVVTPR